jgi:hypothetical protein
MSHPLLLNRLPRYVPATEADNHTARIAAWLEDEGYIPAATILRAMVRRHEVVTQAELLDASSNGGLLASLLESSPPRQCRIWANKHGGAYWRAGGNGYTTSALEAGVFTFSGAWVATRHIIPAHIEYEILGDSTLDKAGVSGLS